MNINELVMFNLFHFDINSKWTLNIQGAGAIGGVELEV